MQHVDRVSDVEPLSLPSWSCGPWTHDDPGLSVVRLDGSDRVGRRLGRTRYFRYHATVRAAEARFTHQAVDPPDNPPRGRPGDGGGRAARGLRASSVPRWPSAGCGEPGRSARGSPENGNCGPGGAALASTPAESSASWLRWRSYSRAHRGP